ncbi:MAG: chromate efflux transporter, partial [Acetobacteraceae bacterium]|nr:chromate efflux transporter [Acetobacteraceae bacterium]
FALCQFMPGPASSQLGMALGLIRAGPLGMFAAWLGFTLPSAVTMMLFAYGVAAIGDIGDAAWLKGLKLVAVAVVAQAVWGMARSLAPDRPRATLAVIATIVTLAAPSSLGQIAAIVMGGVAGATVLPPSELTAGAGPCFGVRIARRAAIALLVSFFVLLVALSPLATSTNNETIRVVAAFYRAGALVFGGGHVLLPLLQAAVVPPGWVSNDVFLAGYGAAQALPGPLSTFAGYLGTVMNVSPNGWIGGLIGVVAIFLPSFLLVGGLLPFWEALRRRTAIQAALRGINAAVVGVLLAALYTPVWTSAVRTPADFSLAAAAFLLLTLWAVPPWAVVLAGAAAAAALKAAAVPL